MMAHNFWPTQNNLTVLYALLMPKTFSGPKAKSECMRETERDREGEKGRWVANPIHTLATTLISLGPQVEARLGICLSPARYPRLYIDRSFDMQKRQLQVPLTVVPRPAHSLPLFLSLSVSLRRRLPVCVFINFLFDFCFMACSLWHHSQMSETRDSSL